MRTIITASALASLISTAAVAQQAPAVRPIGATLATSAPGFGGLVFVRDTKSGVLVNDIQNRRLLLLDPTLTNSIAVTDTTPATANAYAGRIASLIAYRGDSSLFVDPSSLSMLVIDPAGKVARVMSVPRAQDAMALGNGAMGGAAFDASGKLVYRSMSRPNMRPMERSANGTMIMQPPEIPDTAAVVRVDLVTRQLDTVGFVKIPVPKLDMDRDDKGNVNVRMTMNPLPTIDEWAVLSDGSVAFIRGRDYHIDWLRPDGSRASSPKIPFEWQRMTDEDKVAFIDSLKAARERMANAPVPAGPAGIPGAAGVAGGGGAGGGEGRTIVIGGGPGGPVGAGGGDRGGAGRMQMNFVAPSDLPDYKPPFFAGATRADADGNLWIRTIPTKGTTGGPIYDVINSKGELIDRVQVPKDRTIIGFGAGGIAYMQVREPNATTSKLERARIR